MVWILMNKEQYLLVVHLMQLFVFGIVGKDIKTHLTFWKEKKKHWLII